MRNMRRNAAGERIVKNDAGRKGLWFLRAGLLMIGLYFGLTVSEIEAEAAQRPVSHGTIIYTEGGENAGFYAADILLLEEKISAVPERCFDPACYAHDHKWEYRGINERTHTRHCADCGDANDLTCAHRANGWESTVIHYEGKTYPGRRYICDCGYQWNTELSHTFKCEAVDEMTHESRCVLGETAYCKGYEAYAEEHYAWYYQTGEDGFHHRKICYDCGFEMEEACSFDETEGEEGLGVCICGRSAGSEKPEETEEKPEESEVPETEEKPDNPKEPETEEEPNVPDGPGTGEDAGGSETGEGADEPDGPESGKEPDKPDGPETDMPDGEDTEDTPDDFGQPETGEAPEEPLALQYGVYERKKSLAQDISNLINGWKKSGSTGRDDRGTHNK